MFLQVLKDTAAAQLNSNKNKGICKDDQFTISYLENERTKCMIDQRHLKMNLICFLSDYLVPNGAIYFYNKPSFHSNLKCKKTLK